MRVKITLRKNADGERLIPDNILCPSWFPKYYEKPPGPPFQDTSPGKAPSYEMSYQSWARQTTVLAEYLDEPIPGFLRVTVIDESWGQNGRVVTLARADIERLEIVSIARVESTSSASEPVTNGGTRETLLEIDEPKKREGKE